MKNSKNFPIYVLPFIVYVKLQIMFLAKLVLFRKFKR